MHVTHVFHSYHPALGGMERVVQKLAEEQSRMGHEVHAVTSTLWSEDEPRCETVNSVRVDRVRAFRLHYPDLAYPLNASQDVLRNSDVVHVHSQNSLFNVAIAKRAKKIGKPIVMEFLAVDYLSSHTNPLIKLLGGFYQQRIQSQAAKLADYAITLNERDHTTLKRKYGLESKIVPHGIDEKYLKEPRDDSLFREKHGVPSRNIIAYVGRAHPSKGLDTLIKALPIVEREVDDFAVVIAGSGSRFYVRRLNTLAKRLKVDRRINLLGYIGEAEKMALLDSSKIFVFPTRHFGEAYPLVVDEAHARDVPVVATKVGTLPCRIKHMETGLLVPPDDPSTLAKAIISLLKNHDLIDSIRERLRTAKRSLLTWGQVCERLDSVYNDVRQSARQGTTP